MYAYVKGQNNRAYRKNIIEIQHIDQSKRVSIKYFQEIKKPEKLCQNRANRDIFKRKRKR